MRYQNYDAVRVHVTCSDWNKHTFWNSRLEDLLIEYCRPKCLTAQLEVVVRPNRGKVLCVFHLRNQLEASGTGS